MSKCKNILITGCNRPNGLGFGLVKLFLEQWKPEHLVATCRDKAKAKELNELAASFGNLHVVELDLQNFDKFDTLLAQVDEITGGEGINLLINNAGFYGKGNSVLELTKEEFVKSFEINTLGPIFLTKALLPLLEKAAQKSSAPEGIGKAAVVNLSTKMASIADNTSGGSYYYRTTKTALNMATKSLGMELKNKGIVTLLMHPGWVQTDMGGPGGLLTPEQSVSGMAGVIEKLKGEDNGKFVQFDGKEIPW